MSGIAGLLASIFTGPLVKEVLAVIERVQKARLDRAAMEAELKRAIAAELALLATTEIEARRDVIVAELRGESWLQRTWRPLVAVTFAAVIVFYGLILPIAVDWFGAPPVRIGDTLLGWIMTTVNIAIGGYIGGRTLEKVARSFRAS